MFRLFKMWFLLRRLKKWQFIPTLGIEREKHPNIIYINEIKFVESISVKKIHPNIKSRPCHKCNKEAYEEYEKQFGKKISEKMLEYYQLIKLCEEEGYIESTGKNDSLTHECKSKFIKLSNKGYEFTGVTDFIEKLLTKYKLTWTLILLPIISFTIGYIIGNK